MSVRMNAKGGVFNLTVSADRLRLDLAEQVLPVLEHEVLSAAIVQPKQSEFLESGQSLLTRSTWS